jgi:hypothetical protein
LSGRKATSGWSWPKAKSRIRFLQCKFPVERKGPQTGAKGHGSDSRQPAHCKPLMTCLAGRKVVRGRIS